MNRKKQLMILTISLMLLIGTTSAMTKTVTFNTSTGKVTGSIAADAKGNLAFTMAGGVGTSLFDVQSFADDTSGVAAGQSSTIVADAAFIASGAVSRDGNAVTITDLVNRGMIITPQDADVSRFKGHISHCGPVLSHLTWVSDHIPGTDRGLTKSDVYFEQFPHIIDTAFASFL